MATRQTFEQWVEEGSPDSRTRANVIWKQVLEEFEPPPLDDGVQAALEDFVERGRAEGGSAIA